MIHAKKWMVVPYESDEEILEDDLIKNMSDFDKSNKIQDNLSKAEQKNFQKENELVSIIKEEKIAEENSRLKKLEDIKKEEEIQRFEDSNQKLLQDISTIEKERNIEQRLERLENLENIKKEPKISEESNINDQYIWNKMKEWSINNSFMPYLNTPVNNSFNRRESMNSSNARFIPNSIASSSRATTQNFSKSVNPKLSLNQQNRQTFQKTPQVLSIKNSQSSIFSPVSSHTRFHGKNKNDLPKNDSKKQTSVSKSIQSTKNNRNTEIQEKQNFEFDKARLPPVSIDTINSNENLLENSLMELE
jgi:hypothetical protein